MRARHSTTGSIGRTAARLAAIALVAACGVDSGGEPAEPIGAEGIPRWIPIYPGSELELVFATEGDTRYAGSASFRSASPPEMVLEFYRGELASEAFKSDLSPFGPSLELGGMITAHSTDETRGLTLTVTRLEEGCEGIINFTQATDEPPSPD